MLTNRTPIGIVWLKRDLRLHDHAALHVALKENKRVLLVYVFETVLAQDPHYSSRHFDFIKQSLIDMNRQLVQFNTKILIAQGAVLDVFCKIKESYTIDRLYSHQETGLRVTFDRDKEVKKWADSEQIHWKEHNQQGVFRGMTNRKQWLVNWTKSMNEQQYPFPHQEAPFLNHEKVSALNSILRTPDLETKKSTQVQLGGSSQGRRYLDSFFKDRHHQYQKHISKPDLARKSCSRLSPYIAYGNLSMREVLQRTEEEKGNGNSSFGLRAFESRLRWQAHFIQKFEMECSMEFVSVNKGYHRLSKPIIKERINAWEKGQTGIPIVDASMRCLVNCIY